MNMRDMLVQYAEIICQATTTHTSRQLSGKLQQQLLTSAMLPSLLWRIR